MEDGGCLGGGGGGGKGSPTAKNGRRKAQALENCCCCFGCPGLHIRSKTPEAVGGLLVLAGLAQGVRDQVIATGSAPKSDSSDG
ncbi:hypothetical protein ZHAS_00018208 [Anopheles sinensis]|uniref:Uncharacterized protein n=1 Tax=Anopheles sinensis TaxID=74873 RepID=A0A084WIV3_ANOSI|nr:hypothetical protein ZHAS_00018208 [Anopheles sinensis]